MKHLASFAAIFALAIQISAAPASAPGRLELQPGDHVCLLGNALAERMQHDNHWETLLHQRFPKLNLVVRNLAFTADEVDLKTELVIENSSYSKGDKVLPARLRSQNFGSPDQHLTFSKATVVLAFFGFNESFAGPAGVAKFKADLTHFIEHTRKQNYSGAGAPGSRSSRPSLTRISVTRTSPTARPTTRTSSSTPTRWQRWRRKWACRSWIFSHPHSRCIPPQNLSSPTTAFT